VVRRKAVGWVAGYARVVNSRLKSNIYPWLGKLLIVDVTSGMLMACLQRRVDRGAAETAYRTLNCLVEIYRWAIRHNMVERNMAADLIGALPASIGSTSPR
jgi:hypothetical protein